MGHFKIFYLTTLYFLIRYVECVYEFKGLKSCEEAYIKSILNKHGVSSIKYKNNVFLTRCKEKNQIFASGMHYDEVDCMYHQESKTYLISFYKQEKIDCVGMETFDEPYCNLDLFNYGNFKEYHLYVNTEEDYIPIHCKNHENTYLKVFCDRKDDGLSLTAISFLHAVPDNNIIKYCGGCDFETADLINFEYTDRFEFNKGHVSCKNGVKISYGNNNESKLKIKNGGIDIKCEFEDEKWFFENASGNSVEFDIAKVTCVAETEQKRVVKLVKNTKSNNIDKRSETDQQKVVKSDKNSKSGKIAVYVLVPMGCVVILIAATVYFIHKKE